MKRLTMKAGAVLPLALLLAACGNTDEARGSAVQEVPQTVAVQTAAPHTPAPPLPSPSVTPAEPQPEPQPEPEAKRQDPPDMRLEVNLAKRELYVYKGGERVATHPVAVGSKKWPTPTGEWTIAQVIWNPRWIPPTEESWAEDEEVVEPGDPDNPLGRAQLVYRAPNSIHGTKATESLGKAVSHGSIRVSNEVALKLARQVVEAGGAGKEESWYREARENRTERREVLLPNPVPIRVVSGDESE